MVAADHVAIERGDDAARYGRLAREPARAHEAALLGAVPDEQYGAAAGLLGERAADREQRDGRRRVVVRAVPDRVAVYRVAHAIVVLVRAEQHVLAGEVRIAAGHHGGDVDARILERLREDPGVQPVARGERRGQRGLAHVEHGHARAAAPG